MHIASGKVSAGVTRIPLVIREKLKLLDDFEEISYDEEGGRIFITKATSDPATIPSRLGKPDDKGVAVPA